MTYRGRVVSALDDGCRLAGLYAVGDFVRAVFVAADGTLRLETVAAADGWVPTIVDLAPAAAWDEREAADLYGIRFDSNTMRAVEAGPDGVEYLAFGAGDDPADAELVQGWWSD